MDSKAKAAQNALSPSTLRELRIADAIEEDVFYGRGADSSPCVKTDISLQSISPPSSCDIHIEPELRSKEEIALHPYLGDSPPESELKPKPLYPDAIPPLMSSNCAKSMPSGVKHSKQRKPDRQVYSVRRSRDDPNVSGSFGAGRSNGSLEDLASSPVKRGSSFLKDDCRNSVEGSNSSRRSSVHERDLTRSCIQLKEPSPVHTASKANASKRNTPSDSGRSSAEKVQLMRDACQEVKYNANLQKSNPDGSRDTKSTLPVLEKPAIPSLLDMARSGSSRSSSSLNSAEVIGEPKPKVAGLKSQKSKKKNAKTKKNKTKIDAKQSSPMKSLSVGKIKEVEIKTVGSSEVDSTSTKPSFRFYCTPCLTELYDKEKEDFCIPGYERVESTKVKIQDGDKETARVWTVFRAVKELRVFNYGENVICHDCWVDELPNSKKLTRVGGELLCKRCLDAGAAIAERVEPEILSIKEEPDILSVKREGSHESFSAVKEEEAGWNAAAKEGASTETVMTECDWNSSSLTFENKGKIAVESSDWKQDVPKKEVVAAKAVPKESHSYKEDRMRRGMQSSGGRRQKRDSECSDESDRKVIIEKTLFNPRNPEKMDVIKITSRNSRCSLNTPRPERGTPQEPRSTAVGGGLLRVNLIPSVDSQRTPPGMGYYRQYYQHPHDSRYSYDSTQLANSGPPNAARSSMETKNHRSEGHNRSAERRVRSSTEKNLAEAFKAENEIAYYIKDRDIDQGDLKLINRHRYRLQMLYEAAILSDTEYCVKKNVDQILWRSAFYQVIEALRSQLHEAKTADQSDRSDELTNALLAVIAEATVFYENFIEKVQLKHGFRYTQFVDGDVLLPLSIQPAVRSAILLGHHVAISLGDLYRYEQQTGDKGQENFTKATKWYSTAHRLEPKNGRPLNQLAIISVITCRKLDAVYYYMRSLAAPQPFTSAKESLVSIFQGVLDKCGRIRRSEERKSAERTTTTRRESFHRRRRSDRRSTETWVLPDGTLTEFEQEEPGPADAEEDRGTPSVGGGEGGGKQRVHDERKDHERDHCEHCTRDGNLKDTLSALEVNKKSVLSFLHVHAMLYTKIGMETFSEAAEKMLHEFRCILTHLPLLTSANRYIHLICISLFSVHNPNFKADLETDKLSHSQRRAVQVTLELMSIMLERFIHLLRQCLHRKRTEGGCGHCDPGGGSTRKPKPFLGDFTQRAELEHLLPVVKVWFDWLVCHRGIWDPPVDTAAFSLYSKCGCNAWSLSCAALNLLKEFDVNHEVVVADEDYTGYLPLNLPEDCTLAGFTPLIDLARKRVYYNSQYECEHARNVLRVKCIMLSADVLMGLNPPMIDQSLDSCLFVSAVTTRVESPDEPAPRRDLGDNYDRTRFSDSDVGGLSGGSSEAGEDAASPWGELSAETQTLHQRRMDLERRKNDEERRKMAAQAVLDDAKREASVRTVVVCRRLVMDTNCYIDHLPAIKGLVDCKHFIINIPIIVYTELEGLSKGQRDRPRPTRSRAPDVTEARRLQERAREASTYIQMAVKEGKVEAISSCNNLLRAFYSETVKQDEKKANDDVILGNCLHFLKTPRTTDREVEQSIVLITDDRNLRVKAHGQKVPTRSMDSFLDLMRPCLQKKQLGKT